MLFTENNTRGVVYMTSQNIQTVHAFTTRYGGVSEGIFATLNLGLNLGDARDNLIVNYAIIRSALSVTPGGFACSNQTHGSFIRVVTRADCGEPPVPPECEADGLITREAGIALTIFTADCVPILLHDPVRGAVGAVHAGWRGTASNIAGEAILKMTREFGCSPPDIRAAIGPCISKCCYETGSDVADALRAVLKSTADSCIVPRAGKYMLDLKEANRLLLVNAGLRDIATSEECTSCQNDKYWSHRRTDGNRGSQAAVITLD